MNIETFKMALTAISGFNASKQQADDTVSAICQRLNLEKHPTYEPKNELANFVTYHADENIPDTCRKQAGDLVKIVHAYVDIVGRINEFLGEDIHDKLEKEMNTLMEAPRPYVRTWRDLVDKVEAEWNLV